MAADFDGPPLYDPLTKQSKDYLSDVYISWISTFVDTLIGYLGQYGILIPRLTTAQRDSIQSPVEGQLIYNTDATIGPPRTAQVQVWQVKVGIGAWRNVTTTP